MYQGVHVADLQRYHEAPVYQTRRDIARLYRDLAFDLDRLFSHGGNANWGSDELVKPLNFQFFRRNWGRGAATFSWMSYLAEQFSVNKVKDAVKRLKAPIIDGRSPLDLMAAYFTAEPRGSHIHQSLNMLRKVQELEVSDELASLFHHELLNVYSGIAVQGAILGHLWEDYTRDGDKAPLGYLVQVTRDSQHGGFPDFFSWDVLDAPSPQYYNRGIRPQYPIDIRAEPGMRRAEERALSAFFQDYLYPLFAYPSLELPSASPTTEGHSKEGIFGFLFVPFYPLYAQAEAPTGNLVRHHFGDWVGILQIELRSRAEKSREFLSAPAFHLEQLVTFLRLLHSGVDDRIDRLVESAAVRWAESQDRMEDPNELCALSIARSVGWDARLDSVDFEGPVARRPGVMDEEGSRFWLQLDWEWPQRKRLQKRTILCVSLDDSSSLGRSGRGPRLPANDEEWREVLPQAYELCRGVHRSVFTWWHAQRSRRINISEQLELALPLSQDWFGTDNKLPISLPHTLPTLTAEVVLQHAATVRKVFPFLPEALWCLTAGEVDGRTETAVKALHENLKATFGRHACVNRGTRPLTVGGALILFMMVLHAEFHARADVVDLGEGGFGRFKRLSPLLPLQSPREALEAYESLTALFRDVIKLKESAAFAVKRVIVDENGRYFDVFLDWDVDDQKRFMERFAGRRRELLPDGDTLGNTVNALWSLIVAGSSGSDVVGRQGLVWFLMKADSFRLRVG